MVEDSLSCSHRAVLRLRWSSAEPETGGACPTLQEEGRTGGGAPLYSEPSWGMLYRKWPAGSMIGWKRA